MHKIVIFVRKGFMYYYILYKIEVELLIRQQYI